METLPTIMASILLQLPTEQRFSRKDSENHKGILKVNRWSLLYLALLSYM